MVWLGGVVGLWVGAVVVSSLCLLVVGGRVFVVGLYIELVVGGSDFMWYDGVGVLWDNDEIFVCGGWRDCGRVCEWIDVVNWCVVSGLWWVWLE